MGMNKIRKGDEVIVIAGRDLTKIIQNSMGFEEIETAADLKKGRTMVSSSTMSLDDVRAFVPKLAGAVEAVARIPVPTLAAVRGAAATG